MGKDAIARRVQINGFFEHACAKKRIFCTRNVKVFGVQKIRFFALRVRNNEGCEETDTKNPFFCTRFAISSFPIISVFNFKLF